MDNGFYKDLVIQNPLAFTWFLILLVSSVFLLWDKIWNKNRFPNLLKLMPTLWTASGLFFTFFSLFHAFVELDMTDDSQIKELPIQTYHQ